MQSNYNQCEHNLDWGETIYEPKGEFEFIFSYDIQESQNMLKVKVSIPLKTSVKELAHRLMTSHQIPCYIYDKIFHSLHAFVDEKTKQFNNDIKTNLFTSIEEPGSKEKLAKEWSKSHRGDKMVGGRVDINFNSSWSDIYHTLIHSPALDALLRLEYSYGLAMKEMVTKKDKALRELQEKQLLEMEVMVAQVGATKTDTDVNRLAANQLEESQMLEIYWSSALSDLQERQKREYRQWVLNVHEKSVAEESCDDMEHPLLFTRTPSLESLQMVSHFDSTHENIMEESFTVHLGTQMKTMHNIRLACRDMLDYCQCKISSVGGNMVPHPQRLQTAMALYSQSLSAMFLLVDDRFESLTGFKKEFVNICNETTDFHFPNYDKQICVIEQALQDRPVRKKSVRTSSFGGQTPQRKTNSLLQTGDFYITKHSNLAEVHAVFHLVTDESVTLSNINSRHPIMVGIRNIMLAAARHNITNIIIPLLLLHEMEENITVQWCMKRAELVLKCVKGFMMESLSWDGHESRTLQFVVPPGISEEMFIAFSNMLPSIFRVSNPLDLSNLSAKGDQG